MGLFDRLFRGSSSRKPKAPRESPAKRPEEVDVPTTKIAAVRAQPSAPADLPQEDAVRGDHQPADQAPQVMAETRRLVMTDRLREEAKRAAEDAGERPGVAPPAGAAAPALAEADEEDFDQEFEDSFDALLGADEEPGEAAQMLDVDAPTTDREWQPEAFGPAEEDLDEAGALFGVPSAADEPMTTEDYIMREVLDTFSGIAEMQVQPVKGFISELRYSPASQQWVTMCLPVVTTMVKSARGMGLDVVAERFEAFEKTLALAAESKAPLIDGGLRDQILEAYGILEKELPDVFHLDVEQLEKARRETLIIMGRLEQIPEIGRVTLDRLFRAGVTSLDAMFLATPHDLARATGIRYEICELICDSFSSYKREIEEAEAMGMSLEEVRVEDLIDATEELRKYQDGFERAAADEWKDDEAARLKRMFRRKRLQVGRRIKVILAEIGAVRLANDLDTLPHEQRVQVLEAYVDRLTDPAEHG